MTAVTSAAGLDPPRRWPALLAWVLWALAMLGRAAVPWMDRLTIRAGRADVLARYYPATGPAALALLSLVLLLTPTGSLPSPGWRRWALSPRPLPWRWSRRYW